jgi:hypothetical protein
MLFVGHLRADDSLGLFLSGRIPATSGRIFHQQEAVRFMMTEVKELDVLQTGKVLAALGAIVAVIFAAGILVSMLMMPQGAGARIPLLMSVLALPVIKFLAGVMIALVYNMIVPWAGGIRFHSERCD